jgi:hypothetical protein
MKRVESARLLVRQYQALIAQFIREGKPIADELISLETCQGALKNLIENERKIRKARREKYSKKKTGIGSVSGSAAEASDPFPIP